MTPARLAAIGAAFEALATAMREADALWSTFTPEECAWFAARVDVPQPFAETAAYVNAWCRGYIEGSAVARELAHDPAALTRRLVEELDAARAARPTPQGDQGGER